MATKQTVAKCGNTDGNRERVLTNVIRNFFVSSTKVKFYFFFPSFSFFLLFRKKRRKLKRIWVLTYKKTVFFLNSLSSFLSFFFEQKVICKTVYTNLQEKQKCSVRKQLFCFSFSFSTIVTERNKRKPNKIKQKRQNAIITFERKKKMTLISVTDYYIAKNRNMITI